MKPKNSNTVLYRTKYRELKALYESHIDRTIADSTFSKVIRNYRRMIKDSEQYETDLTKPIFFKQFQNYLEYKSKLGTIPTKPNELKICFSILKEYENIEPITFNEFCSKLQGKFSYNLQALIPESNFYRWFSKSGSYFSKDRLVKEDDYKYSSDVLKFVAFRICKWLCENTRLSKQLELTGEQND